MELLENVLLKVAYAKEVMDEDREDWFKRGTSGSYCLDVRTRDTLTLKAGERKIVRLGFHSSFSPRYGAKIYIRSGLAAKHGLTLVNGVGVIDSDYRQEWGAIVLNTSDTDYEIKYGERLCQIEFQEKELITIDVVNIEDLDVLDRKGGYGHTGGGSDEVGKEKS